ncbi:MAG: hypothetical protein M1616_06450 [Candidatus Thermoplasmatota archaeon]|jgi:hypothetical protein|nr:hypothetical protein [Candidatus Thermoplasmatota archaeon]
MDYYEYLWGLLKYWLPLTLFVISLTIDRNILLLVISVTWVVGAIFFTMLTGPDDDRNIKKYE